LAKKNDDQEESASSKKATETGTTIGVASGIAIFIVILIVGVVVAIILLRRKTPAVTPHVLHNTEVPDKIKPAYVQSDNIEPTQADAEVVVQAEVITEPEPEPEPERAQAPQSLSQHVGDDGKAFKLGQRVMAHGYQSGVIMYIGELSSMPAMKGMTYIGIKLDKAEGSGDGTVNGVRYFECDPFCSVFVTPHAVKPATTL